jgi:predicted O-linked N-acetylglucosamine transferase (SPINDLY family)
MSTVPPRSLPPLRFLDVIPAAPQHGRGDLFDKAVKLHRMGRGGAARLICHQGLKANPDDLRLLNLGGVLGLQLGQLTEARECLERARALAAQTESVRRLLGRVYRAEGDLAQAAEEFRAVLDRSPTDKDALECLGEVLERQGDLVGALDIFRAVVAHHPDDPENFRQIGILCRRLGLTTEEIIAARKRAAVFPDDAITQREVLQVLVGLHQYEEVRQRGRDLVGRGMEDYGILIALGDAEAALLNPEAAYQAFKKAAANAGGTLGALYRLAGFCLNNNRNSDAIEAYQRIIDMAPGEEPAYANLGLALHRLCRTDEAEDALRKALELNPRSTQVWNNLAIQLMEANRAIESIDAYEKALEIDPRSWSTMSNLCFNANYVSDFSPKYLFRLHRRWGDTFTPASLSETVTHPNAPIPDRPLRIGYVSPDFRAHVVAHFIHKPLQYHDPANVEVYAYANVPAPDGKTEELKSLVSTWRSVVGLSTEEIVETIRADQIDVLVDLAGHTAGHRLQVFGHKPAPIQVTWLGYPNTTGVPAIDYRLTDEVADPSGEADAVHSETLVRLPTGFLCYRPPGGAPPVVPPPAARNGFPTFGCFNNLAKQMPEAVAAWAEILTRLPDARLILKAGGLLSSKARSNFQDRFEKAGVDPRRVTLATPLQAKEDHLAYYGRIDLALDPFPYNGTTTTCESLWMGVPVVALLGDRHAGRVSASILHRIGLDDLICPDTAAYVDTAVALGQDIERLKEWRLTMRRRMEASPLMDGPGFARGLEAAYRAMWTTWCSTRRSD